MKAPKLSPEARNELRREQRRQKKAADERIAVLGDEHEIARRTRDLHAVLHPAIRTAEMCEGRARNEHVLLALRDHVEFLTRQAERYAAELVRLSAPADQHVEH